MEESAGLSSILCYVIVVIGSAKRAIRQYYDA